MKEENIVQDSFLLESEGLHLRVFTTMPAAWETPLPSVQIHHAGGGYETIYDHMAADLAQRGFVGITMIHRGYPGSEGRMEYGLGEIADIGNLARKMSANPAIDVDRMGIMGYSRGAHNALLAIEKYDYFKAGALWSTPVDMLDHVQVNPWIADIIGGSPQEIPDAYRCRSSIHFLEQVNCPLLLLHGESDEVVPVRHTLRLAEGLQKYRKPHELKLFSQEGHIWSPAAFQKNWRLTLAFFERHFIESS